MRSPGTIHQDIDIIAQRLRDELIAAAQTEEVTATLANLAPDGTWPDIDYADVARSHWSPGRHVMRVAHLAAAYRQLLFSADEGDALESAILAALTFWVDRDPQSDNWWFNCIHTPMYVGRILLLMGDTVPQPVWDRAVAIVRRSGFELTGANLTWEAGNLLVLACATRDADLLGQAAAALTREICVTTEEGIQPDFSFHQHGPQLYMSNYGELFSTDNSRYAVLFAGTRFALSDDQIRALSGLIREGQQWFIWGGQFDYHALGRQIDNPRVTWRGRGFAAICRRMATVDPVHAEEYADFAARVTGSQAAGAQAAGASGPRGNRHFWRSDVMVHRPGRFYASVRMHSMRTFATEVWVNRENLQGYHLADGVCFLMQRGDEYHDIQPVWDWRKLPGATCRETAEPLPYGRDLSLAGSTAFVGGVSDGQVGVGVMDYDKDGVQARKAWFFLPDGWVALGAGIRCSTGDPVTTSINQCLLKSEVLLLREGEVAPLTDPRFYSDNLRGVFHDGVGYYLLAPQHTVVQAAPQSGTWTSIEERSPDTAAVTQDVFSLWIEHGHRPAEDATSEDASAGDATAECAPAGDATSECAPSEDAASEDAYAYRVVPGLDGEDFAAYPDTSPVSVPANDARLQAVISSRGTLVQAVFHAAGCLILDDGVSVETSVPCALMLRRTKDGITLSVTEPTQRLETLQVCLSGHYQGCGSVVDPVVGSTTVTVHLPTAAEAGSTAQVMLQPRKQPSAGPKPFTLP